MIILSVDSSSLVTTVALLRDEFILGEYTLNFKREHSVILMEKIETLLQCKIENPSADYPVCNGAYYKFYEFYCTNKACHWTFCRKGSMDHSCIYSGSGFWERDSYEWKHSLQVLFPQAEPLARWVGQRYDWEIYNLK